MRNMIRISFYLDNASLFETNWQNVMNGNPGVGGTEYEIVLLAYTLTKKSQYDVTLFAHYVENFPSIIHVKKVNNIRDAINYAEQVNITYLIFKENPRWIKEHFLDGNIKTVKLIPWCHNYLQPKSLDFYAEMSNIASVICVGREQADLYRDHKLFNKIDYIYNGFPIKNISYRDSLPAKDRQNIVTYMGSITRSKGFHILAKAWPIILKSIKDAQLYVIGSGRVYDDNRLLGKYNIADEAYEKEFMKYLTDSNGNILPSVHFMGRMGTEKVEIIKKTKVGVTNPSGETETFGIGVIEFEIMGCEVVTRYCCGHLDTVYNHRNMYKSHKSKTLAKFICRALNNPSSDSLKVYQYIQNHFSIEHTTTEWEKLFTALENGNNKIHDFNKNIPNMTFRWKWFRIIYSYINQICDYRLPSMTHMNENKISKKIRWITSKRY